MLSLRRSPASAKNRLLRRVPRKGRGNAAYVEEQATADDSVTELLLLGGKGPVDFRVRVAQAHARDDMTPSSWSHLGVLGRRGKHPARRTLYEVALGGRAGIGYPPASNGVLATSVAEYDDPELFPNVALLAIPVPLSKVKAAIGQFRLQRAVMDALELQLAWLAFVWGVGATSNPLLGGLGVPSAAFVEYVVAAAGYDLVPGFPSRSSCPEAIWQAARWWHEYPREAPVGESAAPAELAPISGVYDDGHRLVTLAPAPRRRS